MKKLLTRLLNLVFPPQCPLCGTLTEGDTPRLCPQCLTDAEEELSLPCPICRKAAPLCDCLPSFIGDACNEIGGRRHLCAGFYRTDNEDAALSRLIYKLKRSADESTARVLGDLLSRTLLRHFHAAGEDIRTWVFAYPPRTAETKRRHGMDHAQRLARICAQRTGAAYEELFLRRGGSEQKTLGADERRRNAEYSLILRDPALCRGKKILLIDDVVTTGATLAACAALLREAEAEAVFCASVLKTVPDPHPKKKTKAAAQPLWFQNV